MSNPLSKQQQPENDNDGHGHGEDTEIEEDYDDENAMDWTPTGPRAATASAAASRRRKNKTSDENVWLRPQRFFAPEKPTGLEGLFARTRLDDDTMMMVDGREGSHEASGSNGDGSVLAKVVNHFRRWWWIYATVVVPVVIGVVVRRVWHLEISIIAVEKGSSKSSSAVFESSSPVLPTPTLTLPISPSDTPLGDV